MDITCKDHGTNLEARNKFMGAIGKHGDFLSVVKKRKLKWYGHISRVSCMAKPVLQGTVKRTRMRGRQRKRWEDNIKDRTKLESDVTGLESGEFADYMLHSEGYGLQKGSKTKYCLEYGSKHIIQQSLKSTDTNYFQVTIYYV